MKQSALKKRANVSNKTEYFKKHMPNGTSSKNFWKVCKSFFSNKTNFDDKIILVEKGDVSKNEEIANHFNNYFSDMN